MRTLVDLEPDDVEKLDEMAAAVARSRAALIRQAIKDFLRLRHPAVEGEAFGLWGTRKVDGLAYQRKVRAEW